MKNVNGFLGGFMNVFESFGVRNLLCAFEKSILCSCAS